MADEQGRAGGRARATLEKLGDIHLTSKVSINLRILLEPIGFLRIILIVSVYWQLVGFQNDTD